ncbi:hypothetical protein MMC19_000943, partial [Ptychographa xylographoides]|nr:hypothetical protein [Ptychographa xylographoides]
MAIASGKVSVAFLILRLQSPCVWRTYLVYFFAITAFAVGAVDSVITFAQCSPAYALWTPNVKAECWSSDVLTYFAMSISGKIWYLPGYASHPNSFGSLLRIPRLGSCGGTHNDDMAVTDEMAEKDWGVLDVEHGSLVSFDSVGVVYMMADEDVTSAAICGVIKTTKLPEL